ncbi:hypothetical protein FISHEDRAFT_32644 [Fistulina hepatica ATCC 64428]|uniref:TPR-like protein n=1 Tax=Fistulina hepatica ATCC 64428 TaxID=1128425 RepID=A0A0D7APJ6_9AGAR|nr:hypothetical protein FISHEDRAFT_32644 [Fistulina hepatica ATCC 64428]
MAPPPIKNPYNPADALDDIPGLAYALELFLSSKMLESERYCNESDPLKERLYFGTGYAVIQCVKALMSYEDEDLLAAIQHAKHGVALATAHRRKAPFIGTRLAGYVISGGAHSSSVEWIREMTPLERHAELVYAESLFEKSLLGIVYSGDWLAFLKEILNMRTTMNIYRQLNRFLEVVDAEYAASEPDIDPHFRSGVYLGVGATHLMLSMMPPRLLSVIELFGYKGDRHKGLALLMRAGGWVSGEPEPHVGVASEGIRRSICDIALLLFHLVFSAFTFDGVDVPLANNVLNWNLKRYPHGVFFLFGAGRMALIHGRPAEAIEYYAKAMNVQSQYRNLHHISYWEMAICHLALCDPVASLRCWTKLERESTWSKAIYTYGMAVCMLESGGASRLDEVADLMQRVPELRQRIAGKSIPLEKFVARKARKFISQGRRLCLPTLEIAYLWQAIPHAPPDILTGKMLPEVRRALAALGSPTVKKSKTKVEGYWDDVCLARFLEGVCLRYVAYPDPETDVPQGDIGPALADAGAQAKAAFEAVFTHGPKIELDHHIVYFAHFEYGRLLACQGDAKGAREHFELVLSGKPLEVNPASGHKGKYSMENLLIVRTHSAVDALDSGRLRL